MSGCEAKLDSGNLARAGRERFESQRQNLMNYATENLVDGGFYFLFVFFLTPEVCRHYSSELNGHHHSRFLRDSS